MQSLSIGHLRQRRHPVSNHGTEGFSLLEIMVVITVILIIATISEPFYFTGIERTREAVLHDDLYTMRVVIDRYTLDNERAPASLEELVHKGYLGESRPIPSPAQTKPGKS